MMENNQTFSFHDLQQSLHACRDAECSRCKYLGNGCHAALSRDAARRIDALERQVQKTKDEEDARVYAGTMLEQRKKRAKEHLADRDRTAWCNVLSELFGAPCDYAPFADEIDEAVANAARRTGVARI